MKDRSGVFGVPPTHTFVLLHTCIRVSNTALRKMEVKTTYPTTHRFDPKLSLATELPCIRVRVHRSIRVPKVCHESYNTNISTSQVDLSLRGVQRHVPSMVLPICRWWIGRRTLK